ncbi:MAG: amino acid--tRNA ligase-related protein, partial [Oscillospiraceae bacterium]
MENTNNKIPEENTMELSELLQIKREKLEELKEKGKNPYEVTTYNVTNYTEDIRENFEALEGKQASIAGRIMSRRDMGKANFVDISDSKGRMQCYVRINDIGEESFADFKKYDIGDIVGISGEVFRTKRGEISIHASEVKLLSKSLLPLPEKFHGLKDTDLRYRQRYVDLIMNPEVKDTFVKRSMIIREIRNYLDNNGFLEVETPVLQTVVGGAAARPFVTHHNALDLEMHLRISLELYLKRLIVGGFDKVYEIGRVFRNEGISVRHNPEFTLLELYQAYTDFEGMMNLTENLIREVAIKVLGTAQIKYGDVEIDLAKPF